MKSLFKSTIILLLGLCLGYLIANFKLISLSNAIFWVGFLLSFSIFLLLFLSYQKKKVNWVFLIIVVAVEILSGYLYFHFQHEAKENALEISRMELEKIRERKMEVYHELKTAQELEVSLVLKSLRLDSIRSLDAHSLKKLKELSALFQPKYSSQQDSSSILIYSPGRAKLLQLLLQLELDSVSWSKAIREIDFSYSDLRKADLSNKVLKGINLNHSNLDRANLRHTNLSEADLGFCKMFAADLSNTTLNKTNFNESDLSWSIFSKSVGENSVFDGALLDHAKLDSTQLRECSFRMSSMKGASLKHANFYGTNLWAANLEDAILLGLDLRYGLLKDANISNADLREIQFKTTAIHKKWDSSIKSSDALGAAELISKYKVTLDSNPRYPVVEYYLNSVE